MSACRSTAGAGSAAVTTALDLALDAGERYDKLIKSVLVTVDGRPVYTRYSADSGPDVTHNSYSVTKSVMSMLIGIAIEEGAIAGVDQTLAQLLPNYELIMAPGVGHVTLEQVLTMTGGAKMTAADRFDGKRFNSPNDVCVHPKGWIYFTDPPYGLPNGAEDPLREIDQFGVYRIDPDGKVHSVIGDLKRPNGVTLSPDFKTLYVAQSQGGEAWLMSYPLDEQGNVGKGKILYDATPLSKKDKGMPDGVKTDQQGNIWCTGPGGVLIITPEEKLLGRILTGHLTANCAWGDDGSTLYMTADYYIMRIRTNAKGTGF